MNEQNNKWFSKNNYDTLTASVLVIAGVLLAFISFFMTAAVDEADLLDAQIQKETIRASTTLATGQLGADYAYNQVFRLWQEMDEIRDNAAELAEDIDRADRYQEIRDTLVDLSPLLQDPYWDIEAYLEDKFNRPDILAYEADLYIEQFARERQQLNATTELKNFWRSTSGDYLLMTRILAIGLTLIGIAKTVMDSFRIKFAVTIIVGVIALWVGVNVYIVWSTDPPTIPQEAIDAYAEGEGFFHRQLFADAISSYTAALDADESMIDARERRGFAYRELFLDTLIYEDEKDLSLIEKGIPDLQSVIDGGSTSRHIIAQLAEMDFLLGDYNNAGLTSQYGIDTTDDFMHYFDLGLVSLAEGDIEIAQDTYAKGIDRAKVEYADMVERLGAPSPDFYFSLNLSISELDDLMSCINQEQCGETPERDQLADSDEVLSANQDIVRQLKELTLAFEVSGGETPASSPAIVSDFTIISEQEPDAVNVFSWYDTSQVIAEYDYEDIPEDAVVHIKVYLGTNEYLPMRQVFIWDGDMSGRDQLAFLLGREAGDFDIQMFINGSLVQEGRFTVTR